MAKKRNGSKIIQLPLAASVIDYVGTAMLSNGTTATTVGQAGNSGFGNFSKIFVSGDAGIVTFDMYETAVNGGGAESNRLTGADFIGKIAVPVGRIIDVKQFNCSFLKIGGSAVGEDGHWYYAW